MRAVKLSNSLPLPSSINNGTFHLAVVSDINKHSHKGNRHAQGLPCADMFTNKERRKIRGVGTHKYRHKHTRRGVRREWDWFFFFFLTPLPSCQLLFFFSPMMTPPFGSHTSPHRGSPVLSRQKKQKTNQKNQYRYRAEADANHNAVTFWNAKQHTWWGLIKKPLWLKSPFHGCTRGKDGERLFGKEGGQFGIVLLPKPEAQDWVGGRLGDQAEVWSQLSLNRWNSLKLNERPALGCEFQYNINTNMVYWDNLGQLIIYHSLFSLDSLWYGCNGRQCIWQLLLLHYFAAISHQRNTANVMTYHLTLGSVWVIRQDPFAAPLLQKSARFWVFFAASQTVWTQPLSKPSMLEFSVEWQFL